MLEDIADPDRRPGRSSKTSASSSRTSSSTTSAGPRRSRSTRTTRRSSKAPARRTTSRPASPAIQRELEKSTSDYDKEKLSERIAKLSGGVAKINVGAATESEMKEKKVRVEDAMHATRAANQEGILPGGGVALLRASRRAEGRPGLTHDEEVGYNIVVRACRSPIKQIAENAGEDGDVVAEQGAREQRHDELRLRRPRRPVLRHGQGRHHRPDQGGAQRPAERRQRGDAAADQRRPGGRDPEGSEKKPAAAAAATTTCTKRFAITQDRLAGGPSGRPFFICPAHLSVAFAPVVFANRHICPTTPRPPRNRIPNGEFVGY